MIATELGAIMIVAFIMFGFFAMIALFVIKDKPKCTDCDCYLKRSKRAPEIQDGKVSGITPSFDKHADIEVVKAKYRGL